MPLTIVVNLWAHHQCQCLLCLCRKCSPKSEQQEFVFFSYPNNETVFKCWCFPIL